MPKINLLSKNVAELIAAGEVVERPASVIKELVENSIDAGAHHITVEIKRGGKLAMRITDDGCGISKEDVPLAFMRHATSKISTADDLESINTLGFRGEALAATASVSRIEMLTKTRDSELGTHYCIEGGNEVLYEDAGCPDGTTIIVNDLFYNTPARMKFLKKDVSEGNTVAAIIDRIALSHPEIAFKLIRDGKTILSTSGDGKLSSAVYTVLGRDFSASSIEIGRNDNGVGVFGVICKPISCRQSRAWQYIFLNGRFVNSGTITAAAEQAYKNSAMIGKFPAFVLNVTVPAETVDVNVHPAKTQVRFSDEKRIFDAVYYTVKNALLEGDTRPVIKPVTNRGGGFDAMSVKEYRQQIIESEEKPPIKNEFAPVNTSRLNDENIPFFMRKEVKEAAGILETAKMQPKEDTPPPKPLTPKNPEVTVESKSFESQTKTAPIIDEEPITVIGEAFDTYIVAERKDSIFLIDKHAAHERIIFEEMKQDRTVESQELLLPVNVTLSREDYDIALQNAELLQKAGFDVEDFGSGTLVVHAVPAALSNEETGAVITEAISAISQKGMVEFEKLDRIYYTVACKAATKAGSRLQNEERLQLAKRVLNNNDILYCPHGRPVAFELKRRDLEKQFGRIQ